MSMTEAQERLLYETMETVNNSINMLATKIKEIDERISTIEWRQEWEINQWRKHWERFQAGDGGDTMFSGTLARTGQQRPTGPDDLAVTTDQ